MYTCESFLFRNLVPLTCGQMKATERERGCKIDEGKTIMLARNEWKSGIDVSVRKNVVVWEVDSYVTRILISILLFLLLFFFSLISFIHSRDMSWNSIEKCVLHRCDEDQSSGSKSVVREFGRMEAWFRERCCVSNARSFIHHRVFQQSPIGQREWIDDNTR